MPPASVPEPSGGAINLAPSSGPASLHRYPRTASTNPAHHHNPSARRLRPRRHHHMAMFLYTFNRTYCSLPPSVNGRPPSIAIVNSAHQPLSTNPRRCASPQIRSRTVTLSPPKPSLTEKDGATAPGARCRRATRPGGRPRHRSLTALADETAKSAFFFVGPKANMCTRAVGELLPRRAADLRGEVQTSTCHGTGGRAAASLVLDPAPASAQRPSTASRRAPTRVRFHAPAGGTG